MQEQLPLIVAIAMYAAIIIFPGLKAWWPVVAAGILVVAGVLSIGDALSLINWNILMIYAGSLLLAELFIHSGAPSLLADRILERAPNPGVGITAILVFTGLVSAFVENVATVLVVAPVVLELARKSRMPLPPFMIGLTVMANLQGTATLVGDPPSMIFADFAGYSFNDFFIKDGRLSIFFIVQAAAVTGAIYFFLHFRKLQSEHLSLPDAHVSSWVPAWLLAAMIAGLALLSTVSEEGGIHPGSGLLVMALGLGGLAWLAFLKGDREAVRRMLQGFDWQTMVFLAGIFITIGAVSRSGVLEKLAAGMASAAGGNRLLAFVMITGISVLVSGFVDNVPYIAAMLPVAMSLASSMGGRPEPFMFGLLVGSCIGGNLTPFGASANIVAVSISQKQGQSIGMGRWMRLAVPFTLLTTLVASIMVWWLWAS